MIFSLLLCIFQCDEDTADEELEEARKSFISGHSSMSFYVAIFLIFYIQTKMLKLHQQTEALPLGGRQKRDKVLAINTGLPMYFQVSF
jgi:hypothetical protein